MSAVGGGIVLPHGNVLHVMRERDVGLFSLVQQVVANLAWARHEGRVPVADFRERCCYWTPPRICRC